MTQRNLPERIQAIEDCGYAAWDGEGPDPEFRSCFDETRIPVGGTRHIRVWGLDGDYPDDCHISIQDEKLWQVEIIAKDGSRHEVNASLVRAPLEYTSQTFQYKDRKRAGTESPPDELRIAS